MEEHDDASLMLAEDDHHIVSRHDEEDEENDEHEEHEMHHGEEDEDEHMDIEPNRIEGVSTASHAPLVREDFLDVDPTKEQIWEMKKANKRPSEWLKLLCKDWAASGENLELIETVDAKFESYKPYLKGKLSSQLLCRLCIPADPAASKDATNNNSSSATTNGSSNSSKTDFLKEVLNVQDEFDKAYVIAQVERFCALYDIRGTQQQAESTSTTAAAGSGNSSGSTNNRFALANNEATAAAAAALYGDLVVNAALGSVSDVHQQAIAAAAAATATAAGQQPAITIPPHFLTADATAAAVAAAQQAQAQAAQQSQEADAGTSESHKRGESSNTTNSSQQVFLNSRSAQALLNKAQQQAKSAERALEQERKQNAKREQRRLTQDKKLAKQRDREFLQKQKQAEKLAREKAREEKRTRKLMQRQQRELFAQEQKEAALRRAAELVASNRVPIEITRAGSIRSRGKDKTSGTGTQKAGGANGSNGSKDNSVVPKKRQRSAIVVSTASDLDRIVTHSQNLWAKYNAIAKEHNQRVNWITVAKELGIHVKVREKYARMHSRACQRNFDFVANGHWKIKDHPEIFLEPTAAEQKARMPPPLPPPIDARTMGNAEVDTNNKELSTAGTSDSSGPTVKKERTTSESDVDTTDPLSVSAPSATDPSSATQHHHHLGISNSVDAAAAAATAAAVVDAAGVGGATIDMHHVVELTAASTTVEAGSGDASGSEMQNEESNNGGTGSTGDVVSFEL